MRLLAYYYENNLLNVSVLVSAHFSFLNLSSIAHLQNCLFINQIEQNEKFAKSFSELKYCGYTHSAKYNCIIDWNNFKKTFSNLIPAEHRETLKSKLFFFLKSTF